MKTVNLLFAAAAAFAITACGNSEKPVEEENIEVSIKRLSVDTEQSELGWKGMKSEEYFHTGHVMFSEGSAEFIDGNLAKGTFVVDLTKIVVEDEGLPEDKKQMLAGHLQSPDFFNVEEHNNVEVEVGQIQGGMAPVKIMIMGQTLEQNLPLTASVDDNGGSITGQFEVDFSALDRNGFKPKEGQEEFVQPTIMFDLNIVLK